MSTAVFGYGSLVSASSVEKTIGRPVELRPASLRGWQRSWSLCRDNVASEKTFALSDGRVPQFIIGLNVVRGEAEAGPVNGAIFELDDAELERLDLREMRYDRVDVGGEIAVAAGDLEAATVTYTAKPEHYAAEPPADAFILAKYAGVVEHAFELLGPGELERFRATTGPHPVPVAEATLVKDEIPAGNPRAW